nr:MAG TPA: hypothetical protein [Caudoviricetes sp.]
MFLLSSAAQNIALLFSCRGVMKFFTFAVFTFMAE